MFFSSDSKFFTKVMSKTFPVTKNRSSTDIVNRRYISISALQIYTYIHRNINLQHFALSVPIDSDGMIWFERFTDCKTTVHRFRRNFLRVGVIRKRRNTRKCRLRGVCYLFSHIYTCPSFDEYFFFKFNSTFYTFVFLYFLAPTTWVKFVCTFQFVFNLKKKSNCLHWEKKEKWFRKMPNKWIERESYSTDSTVICTLFVLDVKEVEFFPSGLLVKANPKVFSSPLAVQDRYDSVRAVSFRLNCVAQFAICTVVVYDIRKGKCFAV